jgi:membrane associated rhomboid family serine protease
MTAFQQKPGPLTWGLIAVMIAVFFMQLLNASALAGPDVDALARAGNLGYLSLTTEPWRLFTAIFMHADWVHLLLNLSVLAFIGAQAEAVLRGRDFAIVFLGGGLLASLGSAIGGVAFAAQRNFLGHLRYDLIVGVGASGALMACCGALLMAYWVTDDDTRHPVMQAKNFLPGVWSVTGLTLMAGFAMSSSDQIAHIAGLIAGGFLASVLMWVQRTSSDTAKGLGLAFALTLAPTLIWLSVPATSAQELASLVQEIKEEEKAQAEWERARLADELPPIQPLDDDPIKAVLPMWSDTPGGLLTLPSGNQ